MTALETIPSLSFVNFIDVIFVVVLLGKGFICDTPISFLNKITYTNTPLINV